MDLELKDRNVVVSGAGGALGGAVTRLLVEQGAVCHLPLRAARAPRIFGDSAGDRVHIRTGVDLTDPASVRGFYASLPGLWASVHCAGGFAMASIAETSFEAFSRLLAMNTTSAFLCCREALRKMSDGGRIVNVAARPALEPRSGGGMVAYTVSKGGVAALTQALAEEVAAQGVWVNAVAPSILDTPANRKAMPSGDHASWPGTEEVAATMVFLASPANRSTRGAVVPVYGKS